MKDSIKKDIAEALIKLFNINDNNLIEVNKNVNKHVSSDYYTNVAMRLAKPLKKNPIQIAEEITKNLKAKNNYIVDIAKPGYINFSINISQKNNVVTEILNTNNLLAGCDVKKPKKFLVEFVSANPTGPLHVGHGRGAVYGNIISKFLKIQGHTVVKEYYVNNFGNQINNLVLSVFSHLDKSLKFDESELYKGKYIEEISKNISLLLEQENLRNNLGDLLKDNKHRKILDRCKTAIIKHVIDDIKNTLNKLDIEFDNWFYESTLFEDNLVDEIIQKLKDSKQTQKTDGALMFLSDEPRVLIKTNGEYTYFASDLAYHDQKMKLYDHIINVWGADHHGYVPRINSGLKALGHDINKLDIHLIQFANLYRGKEKISMSTRKGEFVKLDTLADEIGVDAINYFYLTKNKDQHLDFDLDIAISTNKNNPVYYIQYAHARIEKILNQLQEYNKNSFNPNDLKETSEIELITLLMDFKDMSYKSITSLKPNIMTNYLYDLAQQFHSYYTNVKIIEERIIYSRVYLIAAIQRVIRCGLETLNINAPTEM